MTAERPRAVTVFAPAKINLTLHVTGRRDDGYHLLDSLVTFASVGDRLHLQAGATGGLRVTGPERAGVPTGPQNLVARVAALAGVHDIDVTLDKKLLVASGIGGGSADAAAAFRGLMALGSDTPPAPRLYDPARTPFRDRLLSLGADIPVCLQCRPARMRGIGDRLDPVAALPSLTALLVNPRVEVSTPSVFAALARRDNAPMPDPLPRFDGPHHLVDWLRGQRNDLQAAAVSLAPAIGDVLTALDDDPDCLFARMSGSGATCFGIFEDKAGAERALGRLSAARPGWWIVPARLGGMAQAALPRVS